MVNYDLATFSSGIRSGQLFENRSAQNQIAGKLI